MINVEKMKLITLSAKARCGKDTTANYLTKRLPKSKSLAFASSMKDSIASTFSDYISREDVFGTGVDRNSYEIPITSPELKKRITQVFEGFYYDTGHVDWSVVSNRGLTIRKLMQAIGTDIGVNQLCRDMWVNEFSYELTNIEKIGNCRVVIVTDCRQEHEMAFLRQQKSVVIHIMRETGLEDNHVTEKGLPVLEGDFVVDNNSTLENLYLQLDGIIEQLKL